MTEHAGPGPAPVVPHARRPVLRVVGGTAAAPARHRLRGQGLQHDAARAPVPGRLARHP